MSINKFTPPPPTIGYAKKEYLSRRQRTSAALQSRRGQIQKPYLWIDAYNKITSEVSGTITTRVDARCMNYVSVEEGMFTDFHGQETEKEMLSNAVCTIGLIAYTLLVGGL